MLCIIIKSNRVDLKSREKTLTIWNLNLFSSVNELLKLASIIRKTFEHAV